MTRPPSPPSRPCGERRACNGDKMSELMFSQIINADPRKIMTDQQKTILEVAKEAVVLRIDNVARYYFEVNSQENWSLETDFPNIAPPFEAFWMEYKSPGIINSEGKIKPVAPALKTGRFGALFTVKEIPEIEAKEADTDAHWAMTALCFVDLPGIHRGLRLLPFYSMLGVTKEGQLATIQGRPFTNIMFESERIPEFEQQGITPEDAKRGQTFLYPMLLALSFLHCKNVEIVSGGKIRVKSAQKAAPKVKVYTLQIEPIKKILDAAGARNTGIKQALHICRGHFKDFSKGKGLFGKYKGLYWWDAQVRGSAELGFIAKDYQVNPGNDPQP